MVTTDLTAGAALFREHRDSVLFVTSQLRARELKMAHGLRLLGWKVGLVYTRWTPFQPDEHFDFSVPVATVEDAHRSAVALAPRACHVFSGAIDDLVLRFCREKPCPVVIDLNDVFAPSLFDYCHERFEPTREALSLADGFCARDLQVVIAERSDGFRLPPHVIFFPEYAWNDRPVPERAPEQVASDDVHVVSVGTFSLETQGMYDSCYLQLVRMFADEGIHFHIYPHWSYRKDHSGSPHAQFERDFADFLALERRSPYVHVHDSLPIETLRDILPRYDFGIVSGGCPAFGQTLELYKRPYLETCYSGRIADYLDARLPVLVNDEVKFDFDLLKRYGACVDLKGLLGKDFKASLIERKRQPTRHAVMERAARLLSVDHNAPRLASFYRSLMLPTQHQESTSSGVAVVSATPAAMAPIAAAPATASAPMPSLLNALWRRIRWLSPRVAKIVLPYRAIRMFEVRLHNSLQEVEQGRATISALRAAADDNRRVEAGLRQDLHAVGLSNEALQTRVARADEQVVASGARIAALEHSRAEADAHAQSLHSMLGDLRNQIARLDRTAGALREEHARLDQSHEVLRTALRDRDAERAVLSRDLSEMRVARDLAREEHDALVRRHERALLEQQSLEQARAEAYAEAQSAAGVAADLRSRLATVESELRTLAGRTDRERILPVAAEMTATVHRLTHQPDQSFVPLDDAPKLLLACMPKSGSTWLTNVLEDTLGLPARRCYLEADRNEQELDAVALFQSWGQRTLFVQQHIRYSRITLGLCRAFSTKIVVLTRRLDDVVVSLRDHVERESPECSMFYTETEWFAARTPEAQLDFIIDHAMPWYLNFFVGWHRALGEHPADILHVRYEDLLGDSAACVDRIARFYGTSTVRPGAVDLDRRVGTRFNQGRIGRGSELLSAQQQARLRQLAAPYEGVVDLGTVGL